MSIKRVSKAILPKPYDGKVSKAKLIKDILEIYVYFTDELKLDKYRPKLKPNENGEFITGDYMPLYDLFYKATYNTEFIHSIQIKTAEIYSYIKEHYHIIYFMLYGRPSYNDFTEHYSDILEELNEMFNEIQEYRE